MGCQPVFPQVVFKQVGGVYRHGAVQEHVQCAWNVTTVFQLCNGVEQRLRPADGKYRHHCHAAAFGQSLQCGCQFSQQILCRMASVAIGGFDQYGIGCRGPIRRIHQGVIGTPQVPGEQNAPSRDFQQHAGCTQDVACRSECHTPALDRLEGRSQGHFLDQWQTVERILAGVQGQGGGVFGKAMAVGECGIFFLNVPAVGQQDAAQVLCARRGVHMPCKPLLGQQRKEATVVQVRMGQHDGVDLVGRDGKRIPVAQPQLFEALEQATVDQQAVPLVAYQIFRPGDRIRSAQESDAHTHA